MKFFGEVITMAIRFASEIIKGIKERGPIVASTTSTDGEEYEKWLYEEDDVEPALMIKENYYPFKMEVILKGYFGVENAQSDIKFFEKNAIAILFSYLRAIVSSNKCGVNKQIPFVLNCRYHFSRYKQYEFMLINIQNNNAENLAFN